MNRANQKQCRQQKCRFLAKSLCCSDTYTATTPYVLLRHMHGHNNRSTLSQLGETQAKRRKTRSSFTSKTFRALRALNLITHSTIYWVFNSFFLFEMNHLCKVSFKQIKRSFLLKFQFNNLAQLLINHRTIRAPRASFLMFQQQIISNCTLLSMGHQVCTSFCYTFFYLN